MGLLAGGVRATCEGTGRVGIAAFAGWMLALTACGGDNALTERVEKLEERLDTLEAERAELQARVDQIPPTEENSAEIAEIRAKLAQTGVTSSDLAALRRRIEALERVVFSWSQIITRYQRSVYSVIHYAWHEDDDVDPLLTFVGTAFAVGSTAIVTNGHIVDALLFYDEEIEAFNERWKMDLWSSWLVVQNLTRTLSYKYNYFWVSRRYQFHRDWDEEEVFSPDVALLRPSEGTISTYNRLPLLTSSEARRLRIGTPVGTLGFPGELQAHDLSDLFPVATFKDGTISAIRMPDEESTYNVRGAYIVQHNLDLSGGTSGSPVFTPEGKVVAINNSGIVATALTFGGIPTQVSQASLGFGIRSDKIHELLSQAGVTAKPVSGDVPVPNLEGVDIGSLEVQERQSDLRDTLEERFLD